MVSENLDFANMTNGIHSGLSWDALPNTETQDAGWLHDSE
jgi:hypothetical protein